MFGLFVWMKLARRARGYEPRSARRIAGARRVLVYVAVMSGLLGVFSLRRAQADTAEAARGLGRDLLALSDVLADGRTLSINGEKIHVASSVAETGVSATLDRFEEHCDEDPGALGRDWTATSVGAPAGGTARDGSVFKLPTYRRGNDEEGVVLCLVRSSLSPNDVGAALEAFARTNDLGALGRMRYAYVRKSGSGAHVLAAWTDDHFNFASLAPHGDADAPGTDSIVVPRPERSRRILSAEVTGTSYAVRVYASNETPSEVASALDEAMRTRGFDVLPLEDGAPVAHEAHVAHVAHLRGYVRGGFVVSVSIEPGEAAAGGAVVSVAELGSVESASAALP